MLYQMQGSLIGKKDFREQSLMIVVVPNSFQALKILDFNQEVQKIPVKVVNQEDKILNRSHRRKQRDKEEEDTYHMVLDDSMSKVKEAEDSINKLKELEKILISALYTEVEILLPTISGLQNSIIMVNNLIILSIQKGTKLLTQT